MFNSANIMPTSFQVFNFRLCLLYMKAVNFISKSILLNVYFFQSCLKICYVYRLLFLLWNSGCELIHLILKLYDNILKILILLL